jgi:predicted small lipoprotein YifL
MKKFFVMLMAAIMAVSLAACAKPAPTEKPTEAGIPAKQEVGTGSKTITLKVTDAEKKDYEITIHTDKKTVGEALTENKLADISDGFLTAILGMEASWEKDKAYWAFYINGEFAMTGVNETDAENGQNYALVYTK